MNRRYLLSLLAVVLVAGIAVAAGVIVNFEKAQTGVYSGPGVPVAKEYSFGVRANDSYYAIPIFMNTNESYYINVTVPYNILGSTSGQTAGLMNQSEYSLFTSNISMNFLVAISGYSTSYEGHGAQTFYAVFLNELNVTYGYNIVDVIVTVNQGSN